MEPSAKYTLVGIATITLVALTVVFVLWLNRAGQQNQTERFSIYFRYSSLSGLQVDGNVTMRGIRVGQVESLQISDKDIELVKVVIKLEKGTPVKVDSKAQIQRNLLTGLAFIDLVNATQKAVELKDVLPGEEYPVIPEAQDQLQVIQRSLPEVLDRITNLLESANSFLSSENKEAVSATLTNIRVISDALAKNHEDIGSGLKSLGGIATGAEQLVENINRAVEQVSANITTLSDALSRQAGSLAQNVGQAAKSLSSAGQQLENPRAAIFGPDKSTLGPGEASK